MQPRPGERAFRGQFVFACLDDDSSPCPRAIILPPCYRIRMGSSGLSEICLGFRKGEIEPRCQRLDIARLDGRAAPDTKAGRRIPVGADVKGGLFLFEQTFKRFREGGLARMWKRRDGRVDNLEADACIRPDPWIGREEIHPW